MRAYFNLRVPRTHEMPPSERRRLKKADRRRYRQNNAEWLDAPYLAYLEERYGPLDDPEDDALFDALFSVPAWEREEYQDYAWPDWDDDDVEYGDYMSRPGLIFHDGLNDDRKVIPLEPWDHVMWEPRGSRVSSHVLLRDPGTGQSRVAVTVDLTAENFENFFRR